MYGVMTVTMLYSSPERDLCKAKWVVVATLAVVWSWTTATGASARRLSALSRRLVGWMDGRMGHHQWRRVVVALLQGDTSGGGGVPGLG